MGRCSPSGIRDGISLLLGDAGSTPGSKLTCNAPGGLICYSASYPPLRLRLHGGLCILCSCGALWGVRQFIFGFASSAPAEHVAKALESYDTLARITPTLHHFITSLLHHFITSSLHHFITSLLHYFITSLLHYFITSLLHYFITSSLHHFITSSLHYFITSLLHYFPMLLTA